MSEVKMMKIPVFGADEIQEEFAYYAVLSPTCSERVMKIAGTKSPKVEVRLAVLDNPNVSRNVVWAMYTHKSTKKFPEVYKAVKQKVLVVMGVTDEDIEE